MQVATGGKRNNSFFINASSNLRAGGLNNNCGQLGDNTATMRTSNVQVKSRVKAISTKSGNEGSYITSVDVVIGFTGFIVML